MAIFGVLEGRVRHGIKPSTLGGIVDGSDAWQDREWRQLSSAAPGGETVGLALLLNCRTIHGSTHNLSSASRPLLLPVYSSADSFCYVPSPITSPHMGDIVRGRPAHYASFDLRPCELPPLLARRLSRSVELQQDAEKAKMAM